MTRVEIVAYTIEFGVFLFVVSCIVGFGFGTGFFYAKYKSKKSPTIINLKGEPKEEK